jgi:hypothetical protein
MMITLVFGQEGTKLSIEVSNDSVLLGNYIEVKFTVENGQVEKFEAPTFKGFNIISGPNQSSSMMISNGAVTQNTSYSYYIEPAEVGHYYIEPAYVTVAGEVLETMPVEIMVVENPDGIIQAPKRGGMNDFFGGQGFFDSKDFFGGQGFFDSKDFFGGEDFFNQNEFFKEFFDRNKGLFPEGIAPIEPGAQQKKGKKKKKKVYKL